MAVNSKGPALPPSSNIGVRLRDAGLAGALGVLLVILAVLIVPQVLAQLPPSQGQIQPGTVLRIGNFTYTPNPSWTEERARIHRGEVSVISKDGQELQVRSIPASTSSQAYVAAAKQLSGSKAASIGSGAPIITPTGLHGLRGTFVSPAGDGTLATFGVRPNSPVAGGVAFVATNQGDNGGGAPQEVDAMINSVRESSS